LRGGARGLLAEEQRKFPNAAARSIYLGALQIEWPEVLSALQTEVFPRLAEIWTERHSEEHGLDTRKFRQFDEVLADKQLDQSFQLWTKTFSITDEWMIESARATMYLFGTWDTDEKWPSWIQVGPKHLSELSTFEIAFSTSWWPAEYGGVESWEKFSDNLRREFNEALNAYRKQQLERFGLPRDNAERDARWTVRYQKGVPAADIAQELPLAYDDPAQTVWKAIDRFAKEIGLTLVQTRRRRTRK
jgi:hypothetical protein